MKNRLLALRQKLRDQGLAGFLIPHTDEHQSEYAPNYAKRLAWLTGFKGSVGLAAVTLNEAAIYVDGRYKIQVREQADTKTFIQHDLMSDKVEDWFFDKLKEGDVIGYDPWLHTNIWIERARKKLSSKNIIIKPVESNIIDEIWENKPAPSKAKINIHSDKYSGEKSSFKRKRIAAEITAQGGNVLALTSLDSIAWLFNIRGTDVDCTPLVLSFALLYENGRADLFVDPEKLTDEVKAHLGKRVNYFPKDKFLDVLKDVASEGSVILIDPERTHDAVFDAINQVRGKIIKTIDPVFVDKSCKNDVELKGARKAHIRDGVAIAKFLCWLDDFAPIGKITEMTAVEKLYELRKEVPLFQDISFDTISGAGPNGAICHYKVTEETSRKIEKGMLYLVDSGGQYLDGTTDITRTIPIGIPTEEQKDRFTRVLKGHIALAQARFPEGRTGAHLDTLARKPLWDVGLDYDHGTGHGVGSYLGVHEGPQAISPANHKHPLKPGMILSNEPGYYKDGEYGIRIENLVIVEKSDYDEEEKPMLTFDTITLAPIDKRLINPHMMTAAEITWLNIYHAKVRETISPYLKGKEKEWLIEATESITIL